MFFKNLFTPMEVAGLEVPNRFVFNGMHSNLGGTEAGIREPGKDFIAARAAGGFGMVCVGIIDSYPWAFTSDLDYRLDAPEHVENHADVVEMIADHGAVSYAQIGPRRVWPTSEIFRGGHRLSELEPDVIEDMIQSTVEVGVNAYEAGYDAVELLGMGGGALSMFLSKRFNDRDDEWGGSLEDQLRFPRRMIAGIKERVDVPVFYRMHGDEYLEDGYTVETEKRIAQGLVDAGVDYLNVTGGSHATSVPQLTPDIPRGTYGYLAREIKSVVDVPVAAANRINHPRVAERLLRDGWADFVSLGRGGLADPELPNKTREGRLEDINLCIACNECMDVATVREEEIRCLVNPKGGRGFELEGVPVSDDPKSVLVAGGGVVGMHAAICCAERGHHVELYEREPFLGGKWRVSYPPPGRGEFYHYLRWLVTQVRKNDRIEVALESDVDAAFVRERAPDVLLACFGGEPNVPDIPGSDREDVAFVHEVLEGDFDAEGRVAVIGGGGAGVEAALYLSRRFADPPEVAHFLHEWDVVDRDEVFERTRRGHEVVLVGRNEKLGVGLGPATKWILRKELREQASDVEVMTDTPAVEITDEGVVVERDGERAVVEADSVVLATGYAVPEAAHDRFDGVEAETYFIGDVVDPDHAIEGTGRAQEIALQL